MRLFASLIGTTHKLRDGRFAVKKSLSLIGLVFLILVGAAAAFVLNDPASVHRLTGAGSSSANDMSRPPARQVAQADTSRESAGEKAPQAAAEQGESQEFDRKAADRKQASRPPTKQEFEQRLAREEGTYQNLRTGRYVGPVDEAGTSEPPPPGFYPIKINRRTYPDANSITVELAVQNASGTHWKTAYVTLRSSQVAKAQLFEIEDWKIDEVVGLEYTFPRTEIQQRMRNLRVLSVSGQERESALANMLSNNRRKLLEEGNLSMSQLRERRGDVLAAPGLLSYLGRFQTPFTGIQIEPVAMIEPRERTLQITLPEDQQVPENLGFTLRETSEERREVGQMLQEFHQKALDAQNSLRAFAGAVNSNPRENPLEGSASSELMQLRQDLEEFDQAGLKLAGRIQRSSDKEVRQARQILADLSTRVLNQINTVENSIQSHFAAFHLRET